MLSMPRAAAPGPRPSPATAYSQWIEACVAAGWRGVPAVEEVPTQDGHGRVAAAPARARWAAPRFACAAMDGIAIVAAGRRLVHLGRYRQSNARGHGHGGGARA